MFTKVFNFKLLFARIKNLLAVLLLLFIGFLFINGIGYGLFKNKIAPKFNLYNEVSPYFAVKELYYLKYTLKQACGAFSWLEKDPDNNLGLFIGASTVRMAADPIKINEGWDDNWRWLITGSVGGSFGRVAYFIQWLQKFPNFKPKFIVIGVHPVFIKGLYWERQRFYEQQAKKTNFFWLYNIKDYFRAYVQTNFMYFKFAVLDKINCDLCNFAKPTYDPWRPIPENGLAQLKNEQEVKDAIAKRKLYFAVDVNASNEQLQYLISAIKTSKKHWNVPTYLVFMPQAPYMQDIFSEDDFELVSNRLRQEFADSLDILDLRYSLNYPKEYFLDPVHLNLQGKEQFSKQLSNIIRDKYTKS